MIDKIKSTLRKHLIKTKIVDSFEINNVTYRVVDRKSILPSYKNRRDLLLKTDSSSRIYSHSAVYTDTKNIFQPVFIIPQKLSELWSERNNINTALVLGCAGCTFPRFVSLRFPECKTVGVEYEKKFIDIAWKYFWIKEFDEKFTLLHGDAFEYVKDTDGEKYDVIYIDIFSENSIPQEVMSNEFLNDINNCSKDNSITIINLLEEKTENVISFAKTLPDDFNEKYVLNYDVHCFLIAVKSTSDNGKADFIKSLRDIGRITII